MYMGPAPFVCVGYVFHPNNFSFLVFKLGGIYPDTWGSPIGLLGGLRGGRNVWEVYRVCSVRSMAAANCNSELPERGFV